MSNAENYLLSKASGVNPWAVMTLIALIKHDKLMPTIERNGTPVTVVDRSVVWRKKMKKLNDEQFKDLT